jgi:dephospho-CoA kinase
MRLVIGLVGENGSGKSAFAAELRRLVSGKRVSYRKFSDILIESLTPWGVIESSRENLQRFPVVMEQAFGKGILSKAMHYRIARDIADIIIVDGVRWKTDVSMLKGFPKFILVYVTADPKVRFERIRQRKERDGEEFTTFEEFLKQEETETETTIKEIGLKADVKIQNNGSLCEFNKMTAEFYESVVKPAL